MKSRFRVLRPAVLACAAVAACSEPPSRVEITARRTAQEPSHPVVPGATFQERFEVRRPESTARASDPFLAYDLPEGWRELPPTRDRYVNLQPGGDAEASCYLTFLQGSAGGLEANVNRWRMQFGLEPLTGETIAGLPTEPLFGRQATLVEAEGSFAGMGGESTREGYALLGLAVCEPAGSLFLKFTGPAPLVASERRAFLELAASLRLADAPATEAHGPGDGHDHGPGDSHGPGDGHGHGLAWNAPSGWVEAPASGMREVTFNVGEDAECYVVRLVGDGGGLQANLERWSRQMGGGPLPDAAIAELPRAEIFGESVPLLELDGEFSGMTGDTVENARLLGVAWIGPQESYFVKMTGPAELVRAERENFLLFLASLEVR